MREKRSLADISVIIPTANRVSFLQEALKSVFSQTVLPKEIFIVDDSGSEKSILEVENLIKNLPSYPSRLIFLKSPKAGACHARNLGANSASAEYLAFLDDDDLWFPTKLELQLDAFKNNSQLKIISCNYQTCKEESTFENPLVINTVDLSKYHHENQNLLIRNHLGSCSFCILKRSDFLAAQGFDEKFASAQDWDLWLRVAPNNQQFLVLPEPLCYSRQSLSGRISTNPIKRAKGYMQFLKKHHHKMTTSLKIFHALRLSFFVIK